MNIPLVYVELWTMVYKVPNGAQMPNGCSHFKVIANFCIPDTSKLLEVGEIAHPLNVLPEVYYYTLSSSCWLHKIITEP